MNKKYVLFFICCLISVALVACNKDKGTEIREISREEIAQVDPVKKYKQKCQMCHGENLNDGISSAKDLSTVGSRLSKEEIKKIIIEGAPGMPKEQLEGAELEAVAEWLANMK